MLLQVLSSEACCKTALIARDAVDMSTRDAQLVCASNCRTGSGAVGLRLAYAVCLSLLNQACNTAQE